MYNTYYQPQMMAPNYRQPQFTPMPPQIPQPQEETLYVPNEQAAEAYLMAPNSFVRLWDANRPVFYEKRTDPQGRPFPMEKYEYYKATEKPAEQPAEAVPNLREQFVTREEFDALRVKIEAHRDNRERGKQNG